MTSNDKETLILNAALQLFSENGYEATRIPQIIKKAGISAGTIYRYFHNKEDILNKLFQRSMNKMLLSLTANYPHDKSFKDQFDFIFMHGEKIIVTNSQLIYFIAKNEFDRGLNQQSHQAFMKLFDFLRNFILKGQEAGVFRQGNPRVLSALLYGGLTFIVDFIIHHNNGALLSESDQQNIHQMYAQLRQTCWDAFTAK